MSLLWLAGDSGPPGSGEHEGMYGGECYHTNVDHGLLGGTQRLWLWVRCPLLELNCLLLFFFSKLLGSETELETLDEGLVKGC